MRGPRRRKPSPTGKVDRAQPGTDEGPPPEEAFPVGEGEKRPRRGRRRRNAYLFFSSLFILRCSFVGISSSAVGIRIRQMKAAVRPPLYRQKPP